MPILYADPVQLNDVRGLLVQIKQFLSKNSQLQGVLNLLVKTDQILMAFENYNTQILGKKNDIHQDYYQVQIVMNEEQIQPIQEIKCKKQSNFLDFFIIDYNFKSKQYEILSEKRMNDTQETLNDRKAILGLLLGPIKDHYQEKEKTSSMTQLHKLTANIPQSSSALVLPNYSNELVKYIYAYQVKQCIQWENKYYLVDRYYCFVSNGLILDSLNILCKQIKSRIFQQRVMKIEDPINVNYEAISLNLKQCLPKIMNKITQDSFVLCQPHQINWLEKEITFKTKSTQSELHCPILLFLSYLALNQFKLIMTVSKNAKHKLSDIVLSLQVALKPMKYAFPVVFCSLIKEHCDFVESPVPIMIGYWGSEIRKQKFVKQLQNYIRQHQRNNEPAIVALDLQTISISNQKGVNTQDIYILQNLNWHMKKYGKGNCLSKKISNFIRQIIENIENKKNQNNQWMKLLKQKIQKSQMYSIFIQN